MPQGVTLMTLSFLTTMARKQCIHINSTCHWVHLVKIRLPAVPGTWFSVCPIDSLKEDTV